jgi:hypothetical protein
VRGCGSRRSGAAPPSARCPISPGS